MPSRSELALAAERPGSANGRPGSADGRPGSADGRPGSAAGRPGSADTATAVGLPLSSPVVDGRSATDFRLRPAPGREPPFDDETVTRRLSLVGSRDQQLPLTVPQSAQARFRLPGRVPLEQLPERDDLPDPGGFARRFAIAVIEAATGRRTPGQLGQHTSAGVLAGLVRDGGRINRLGTATRPASLHSLHLAEPADGVIEAAAIVRVGTRYRAIAFRLEGTNGRWRCVRLQIG